MLIVAFPFLQGRGADLGSA